MCDVEFGKINVFIGQNGSGKSTFISSICDMIPEFKIFDRDVISYDKDYFRSVFFKIKEEYENFFSDFESEMWYPEIDQHGNFKNESDVVLNKSHIFN